MTLNGKRVILPWIVKHAAATISIFRVGKYGRSAIQRLKGNICRPDQGDIGECVMYLKPGSEGRSKADVMWKDGVYLGMISRTEEYWHGAEKGVIKVRTIIRPGMKDLQSDNIMLEAIHGVPWEPIPGI